MNYPLLTKYLHGYRFEVFLDDDFIDRQLDKYILKQLEDGELTAFIVTQSKQCGECSSWHEIESIGGIIGSTDNDALDAYINDYGR